MNSEQIIILACYHLCATLEYGWPCTCHQPGVAGNTEHVVCSPFKFTQRSMRSRFVEDLAAANDESKDQSTETDDPDISNFVAVVPLPVAASWSTNLERMWR